MQRYFVPENNWQSNSVSIDGEDAHHIIRVMRMQIGDEIICNTPQGQSATCKISMIQEKEVVAEIIGWLDKSSELPVFVTIAQGLPKGDKMDLVLQKGTELGAKAFIPFQAERSVVKWDSRKVEKKLSRYAKIVKEASEQSHRNYLPEIKSVMNLQALIMESKRYDVKIIAYEEEAKTDTFRSFASIVKSLSKDSKVLVCIGPEGGLSMEEVNKLKEYDFIPVRLGPRILRTETAALYVLSSISYHLEELEGLSCQQ
ncbi:16S rRNA (uracil(1498)-N(3))-methyltransferase [Ornithinibacillus halotolerans]|uniref:Ribosomal RNA small subunit methyltransferase E n=1 Tax=Ornithinibacillus halotolerans TaxID=1274357 RepID=A0A916RTC3_9BACI|nr:16S rRNA (uracil(1498)-N(3))-methyltransferase [Ornithinibacillus halotolerans]GGA68732.1 ribosomal RNA small subunit methyltransferase E [Ornithinibacillus halotolerans]